MLCTVILELQLCNRLILGCFGVAAPTALSCIRVTCRHRSRFSPRGIRFINLSRDCTVPCSTGVETGQSARAIQHRPNVLKKKATLEFCKLKM